MIKINYVKNQQKRYIGYFLVILGVFIGLITLGVIVEEEIGVGIFLGIITFILLGYGYSNIRLTGVLSRYIYLIENGNTEIKTFANLMKKPENEILEDIEEFIKTGIFFNIYLNREKMKIEEIIKINNEKSNNIFQNKVDEKKVKSIYCPNCGAKLNEKKECEYCGTKLNNI